MKCSYAIIIAQNGSCGKIMFSQVSVCPVVWVDGMPGWLRSLREWDGGMSGRMSLLGQGRVFPGGWYVQGVGMSRGDGYVQRGGGYVLRGWVCPGGGHVYLTHGRIQDFLQEGAPTLRGGINIWFCQNFRKTAWNGEKNLAIRGGGGGVPGASP